MVQSASLFGSNPHSNPTSNVVPRNANIRAQKDPFDIVTSPIVARGYCKLTGKWIRKNIYRYIYIYINKIPICMGLLFVISGNVSKNGIIYNEEPTGIDCARQRTGRL